MPWRTLFLDLDDTLYPSSSGLWDAIGDRISRFMTERVGIPPDRAPGLRAYYFKTYGTTLNGLIVHHQVDPAEYLDYVHDVPVETMVQPDPALRTMLTDLPQKRVVFTNANRAHAERVMRCLGVEDQIDLVVDIFATDMLNKPELAAYQRAMALSEETDAEACVIVDDLVRNLRPAGLLGMTTVLVAEEDHVPGIDRCIPRITDLTAALPGLREMLAA
jgi:putative hydrolase of the HAD superfamily